MKSRIVVAAIIEKDGKILLGKKSDGVGPYPGCWHIPGGGVNLESETLEDAMRREIREETGLETGEMVRVAFDEDNEPDKHGEMTHYVFLVYRTQVKNGNGQAADDLKTLQWVDKGKLKNLPLTRPSVKLFSSLGWI